MSHSTFGGPIRVSLPDVDEQSRLLRPTMMEALLYELPCSKGECLETIPGYLRTGTAPEEGQYLNEVLEMISEYG